MGCFSVRTRWWATPSHVSHIIRGESTLHVANPSVLKVGDSAKAQKGASGDGFASLLVNENTEPAADFIMRSA